MSIPREEFDRLDQIEAKHWWFDGMRAITRTLIRGCVGSATPPRWLEVGCGTGYSSRWLAEQFQARLVVTDLSDVALRYARQRGLSRGCQATITALPFASGWFDVVSCLDVLCHLESSELVPALSECRRVLRPGGILLLRAAAYARLAGFHAHRWEERQRFTAEALSQLVADASFRLLRVTYANMFLFPLAAFKRLVLEPFHLVPEKSDLFSLPRILEGLINLPLRAEARLLENPHTRLPFGLSVLAIAQKT